MENNIQNEDKKVKLSLDEFLLVDEKWQEKEAVLKKKRTKLAIAETIVIFTPFLFYFVAFMDMALTKLLLFLILYGIFSIAAIIFFFIWAKKIKAETESSQKELYTKYLKDNGFI